MTTVRRIGDYRVSGTAMAVVMVMLYANVSWYSLAFVFPLALMCASLALLRERERIGLTAPVMAWVGTLAVVILDNRYHMLDGTMRYVALVLVALLLAFSGSWERAYIGSIKAVSTVHVIATIGLLYIPGVYPKLIGMLFPATMQSQLLGWYSAGYGAGLGSHYSQNGVFLSLAFGAAFCMLLTAAPAEKRKRMLFLFIAVFALLISGKRGALLFSLAAAAVVYYFSSPRGRVSKAITVAAGGAALLGVVSAFAGELAAYFGTLGRLLGTTLGGDVTGGRAPLYQYAWAWFKDAPILGIGWLEYPLRINFTPIGSIYGFGSNMYTHNIYLQLLAETGIVGFTIFVAAFVLSLRQTLKLLSTSTENRLLLQLCLYVQVFFLLYGLTGNPLYDSTSFVPYVLACAAVVWLSRRGATTCESAS